MMDGCNLLFLQQSSHDSHNSHDFLTNCRNFFLEHFLPQGRGGTIYFLQLYMQWGSWESWEDRNKISNLKPPMRT